MAQQVSNIFVNSLISLAGPKNSFFKASFFDISYRFRPLSNFIKYYLISQSVAPIGSATVIPAFPKLYKFSVCPLKLFLVLKHYLMSTDTL